MTTTEDNRDVNLSYDPDTDTIAIDDRVAELGSMSISEAMSLYLRLKDIIRLHG